MTYINLEDVQKILESNIGCDDGIHDTIGISVIEKINYLPSIDFEEMIKEMIERINTTYNSTHSYNEHGKGWVKGNKDALQELLNKLHK